MDERRTVKRKAAKKSSKKPLENKTVEVKASDGGARTTLIEKIFPSLIAVSISAIFYFTGWVYIAHWYSYYGIDATLVNLPLQIILLHGFPGIIMLGTSGLLAILGVTFYKSLFHRSKLQIEDVPKVIVTAYLISLAMIFIIISIMNKYAQSAINIPVEVSITFLGLLLVVIVLGAWDSFQNFLDEMKDQETTKPGLWENITSSLISVISKKGVTRGLKLIKDAPVDITKQEELAQTIKQALADSDNAFKDASERAFDTLKSSWRIWISAILLFYFLIAISTSALLGEWDAARGGRFMVGDWRIPEVSMYSTVSIPSLKRLETVAGDYFEYQPLGLLTSSEKMYYLVDWKTTYYYQTKPDIYVIPRSDNLILNFIVSPYSLQILTSTPTLAPATIFTPTP